MNYDKKEIYMDISDGFKCFIMLVLLKKRKMIAKLSEKERDDFNAALRYVETVAQEPWVFFSRAATRDVYQFLNVSELTPVEKDALDRIRSPRLTNGSDDYVIIEPKTIVIKNSLNMFLDNELFRDFYSFCTLVQNWEYDRVSANVAMAVNSYKFSAKIRQDTQNLKKQVKVMDVKSGPMILWPIRKLRSWMR